MTQYLYGAAVQGIQSFIFQTNKLREIVGASELVEEICTEVFEKEVGDSFHEYDKKSQTGAVLMASGHIKYIFDESDSALAKVVKNMPKIVQEHAPGITFSQAVVNMTGDYNKDVENLEILLKIQRNKPMRSQTLGLMGILRSRQTGLPVVEYKEKEYLDAAAYAKLYDSLNSYKERQGEKIRSKTIPIEEKRPLLKDLDKKGGNNDWIAVIHIDGNGLGTVVEEVCKKGAKEFKEFSNKLDNAVKISAKEAFNAVKDKFNDEKIIPIRPLILSGEDYNLICRADFAVEYVQAFLATFEDKTSFLKDYHLKRKGEDKEIENLTACAGIAFVKSSFPFYYAYNLGNGLCDFAKKQSERKASCLMFHKVQDSFTESYDEIAERELTPQDGYSWQFGPYYLNDKTDYLTIAKLVATSNQLVGKDGNAIKSHLRQWLSLMHEDEKIAKQKINRVLAIIGEKNKGLQNIVKNLTSSKCRENKHNKEKSIFAYPVYDVLALHSVIYQQTNSKG